MSDEVKSMKNDLMANGWTLKKQLTTDIVNNKRVIKGLFSLCDKEKVDEVFYDIDESGLWIQLYYITYGEEN